MIDRIVAGMCRLCLLMVCLLSGTALLQAGEELTAPDVRKLEQKALIEKKNEQTAAAAKQLPQDLATHQMVRVENLHALTPTQVVERYLPKGAPVQVRWALKIDQASIRRMWIPSVSAKLPYLLVETEAHDLIAIHRKTGEAMWWTRAPQELTGDPCFTDSGLYFCVGARLVCLEPMSGDVIYNARLPFPPGAGPAVYDKPQTLEEDTVFVPGLDRVLYALHVYNKVWPPKGGAGPLTREEVAIEEAEVIVQWRYTADGAMSSNPLYYRGWVYVGGWGDHVYGVQLKRSDVNAPTEFWRLFTRGDVFASPRPLYGNILVPCMDQVLYCINNESGQRLWRYVAQEGLKKPVQLLIDSMDDDWRFVFLKVGDAGPLTCLRPSSSEANPIWSHPTGRQVVGVYQDPRNEKDRQQVVMLSTEDGKLEGVYVGAKDPRSEEQKEKDLLADKLREPTVAWTLNLPQLVQYADNAYGAELAAITEDRSVVAVLEPVE